MKRLGFAVISAVSLTSVFVSAQTITGKDAFADYSQQKPGVTRKITAADLPEPDPSESVDNGAKVIARAESVLPIAPDGFRVTVYAGGNGGPTPAPDGHYSERLGNAPVMGTFQQPRLVRTAPNGDIILSDGFGGKLGGTVFVLRGIGEDGKAQILSRYATGLQGRSG
jgi:hypothetical protein